LERREKSERMVRPEFCLMRIVMMRMSIAVIPVVGVPCYSCPVLLGVDCDH